ncbi:MAG: NADH-quinone oxidoreductase subunit A [Planctomycetota bacterium]
MESSPYLPLIIVVGLAIVFASVGMTVSRVVSHFTMRGRRRSANKDTPYECGMPVLSDARTRFSVKFYIVAMLFILFDIEVVFLYPWAVVFGQDSAGRGGLGLGLLFAELLVFAIILFVGWLYVVRKGVLEWQAEA